GACGHACQSGMVCSGGACMNGSDGTDGGTSAGNPDGATTSVPTCDATRPLACQNAAGPWTCVDPQNDAVNCGGCGRACPAGVACSAGVCAGGVAACAPPLSSCGTACTTLADDPANCGGCGNVCQGGVCGASACQPPGSGKYSDPCVANTDCGAGMMCMDEARFGWGNGFCTTPCDANRSCAAGQACVNVGAKLGNFGLCESKCTADADCPRGYLCGSGLCAPDCRSSTKICPGGQTCDATGRCVPGATMTTTTTGALAVCPGTNAAPVCTNLYYDGANCGTCGNICGSGMYCQGGACIAVASGCPAPGKLCVDQPTGKSYCAYVDADPGNCGFCGNVCSASTYCQSGACVPNDGGASADAQAPICPDPMTKVCPIAAGGYYCALVMNDPANCGACGNACPQGSFCQNFICTATDGGASPACSEQYPDKCPIAGGGGSYCTNLAIDPGNCGVCGAACPGGQACNNATCVPAGGPDGGVAPADGGAT
ncbi:MAG TPA: hypothetical protein VMU50_11330, partial [Polyangia bacterium]|nr:hypothetical protein [Polyangia bacterium]